MLFDTVAMLFFVVIPLVVLFGLFLPEPRFNSRRVYRLSVFRIETTRPAVVVEHDEVVMRLRAQSAIEGIWEKHKARNFAPISLIAICG